ncbi:FIG015547: peptidase, M16 family [hydrothermal vent metagenome]|uniref:FIG015547: peptidase, M16 family n=1 Tax=hydrothermal vent metagenome TaxID=652676 RepID=A0A1W1C8D2_9ZZZZ
MNSFILLGLFLSSFAFANTQEMILQNGLKIIVKENHKAPVFISQIWYKVGASDEPKNLTGISHMLEHMMFKGTTNYPNDSFSKIIAKLGGQENAFTSKDYTGYYQKMAIGNLDIALKLEADRMKNLVFSQAEFNKERNVVIEERRLRIEDKPNSSLIELFNKNFYQNPYQRPVIGWMKDIKSYKLSDLKQWYQRWYIPKNATIVVVGDVKTQDVFAKVKKYFSHIKNPTQQEKLNIELEEVVTKSYISLKRKANIHFYIFGFPAPSLKTTDNKTTVYALDVLSYVLNKRLEKKLVKKHNIASSINVSYSLNDKYDTGFIISFIPSLGQNNRDIKNEILKEIEKIKQTKITLKELEVLKTQLEASFIYAKDSISAQAYTIGALETVGLSWQSYEQYLPQITKITPSQIQTIAQQLLTKEKIISAELIPQKF